MGCAVSAHGIELLRSMIFDSLHCRTATATRGAARPTDGWRTLTERDGRIDRLNPAAAPPGV